MYIYIRKRIIFVKQFVSTIIPIIVGTMPKNPIKLIRIEN